MKCDSSRGPARNAFPLPSMLMLIINAFCAGSSSTAITPHMNLKGPAQNALMMHISIDGKWKYIIPNNFLMIYLTVQFCNRNGGVYIIFIFTLFNPIRLNIPEFV